MLDSCLVADQYHIGGLLPDWNQRLVSRRIVPSRDRIGVRKSNHDGVRVRVVAGQNSDPPTAENKLAAPLSESRGNSFTVFLPFSRILDGDVTDYISSHLFVSSLN